MSGVFQSVLAFVVTLGFVVTVHEFGHFWVARRMGVKILRFSLGFGRPLWFRRFGPDQTEFVIAALPLGGYVKMLDVREGNVDPSEMSREFNHQPLAARAAIVMAGPLFNLLFAVVVYWGMFVAGVAGPRPLIGEVLPNSIAGQAGLRAGDEVLSVDSKATPTWNTVVQASFNQLLDSQPVTLTVQGKDKYERQVILDLGALKIDDLAQGDLLRKIGVLPMRPRIPPVIGEVIPGGAAERSGFQTGDKVLAVDDRPMETWEQWVEYVQTHPEQMLRVDVLRGQSRMKIELRPERVRAGDRDIGRIGAGVHVPPEMGREYVGIEQYSPVEAFPRAFQKTWEVSIFTLKMLKKIVIGQASMQNISGPLSIAQFAGQSASMGLTAFLAFLGVVSVSLGVFNLLPVPVLDGGHLMYYLVEFVSRRPVSEAAQRIGQQIGLAILGGLTLLAFYNDIMRIFN
jgi:regulator of sigma E protease